VLFYQIKAHSSFAMKFTSAFVIAFVGVVSANPLVEKRASASDKATIGYATLSGG
jgi:hypothetical protein